jgi:hypothetical protein
MKKCFGSKYVNVPTDNISNWSASSRRAIFTWRPDIKYEKFVIYRAGTQRPTVSKTEGQNLELSYLYKEEYIKVILPFM